MGAAAAKPAGSAASLLTAGGSGRRAGLRGHRDAPSAAGSHGRLVHRGPWLTPAARSWAGAGRCRRTGATLGTQIPGALLMQAGRKGGGSAEREAAGWLLLPGCRMKLAWLGQVVARRAAWSCSGPSQTTGRGASGSPTPLPPPPLHDLSPASSLRVSAPLAAGRDRACLDCSAKICSANRAFGADTWCRGRALLLAWDALPRKAFQRETRFTPTLLLVCPSAT